MSIGPIDTPNLLPYSLLVPKKRKKRTRSKEKRIQTEAVLLRMTSEDAALFREAAERDERSLSNWMRRTLRRAAREAGK